MFVRQICFQARLWSCRNLGTRCSFLTSFWVRTMDVSRGRWRMHSYGIWKWWRHKYVVYLWNTLLRLALLTLTFGLKRRIIAKYPHFLPSTREKSMIFHPILHKMCLFSSSEQKICKNYLLCKKKTKRRFCFSWKFYHSLENFLVTPVARACQQLVCDGLIRQGINLVSYMKTL